MLTFVADPRDGGLTGSACSTCCCQPFSLMPGETNKVIINYAPWSVPIGNPGLVCGTEFDIQRQDNCVGSVMDGFAPPNNLNYDLATPVSTNAAIDLTTGATPAGNTFSYRKIPFSGPHNGALTATGNGTYTYEPFGGFQGYDWFWYETKDAQGRSIIRKATIKVGLPLSAAPPVGDMLSIPQDSVNVNARLQVVEFPISMPFNARSCETYRLTVRQTARDCDGNCYTHTSCYDVSVGRC